MKRYICILTMALGLLAACNGDDSSTTTPITNNPPASQGTYKSLTITGDVNESASLNEILIYHAMGIISNNKESDLTNQASWAVDANVLERVNNGQYKVIAYPSSGQTTINVSYANNGSTIESSITIKINQDRVEIKRIAVYPQESIDIEMESGTTATYQFSVKGYDANSKEYNLDPRQQTWLVSPANKGATITESGYFQVQSEGTFHVIVKVGINKVIYESSSQDITISYVAESVVESVLDDDRVITPAKHIFYITHIDRKPSLSLMDCPVSSPLSINKNNTGSIESNSVINNPDNCMQYNIPNLNMSSRLYYNSRYKDIYTFGSDGNESTLYKINILSQDPQVESYTMPFAINDISYDKQESNIYFLHTNFIATPKPHTQNIITKCALSIDGVDFSSCVKDQSIDINPTSLTDGYSESKNYMLNYNNKYLYLFNTFYYESATNNESSRNFLVVSKCNFNGKCDARREIDTSDSSSKYFKYDTILNKPSLLLTNSNYSYVYSVGLRALESTIAVPNAFKINNHDGTISINENSKSIFDESGIFADPDNINAYTNLSFDTQAKWAYFGLNSTNTHLLKCSYANVEESDGLIALNSSNCLKVTDFKYPALDISFIPGNQSSFITGSLNNTFFISLATNSKFLVVQCIKESGKQLLEKNCYKYAIPGLNTVGVSNLTKNDHYNKVYIANSSSDNRNTAYAINALSHKIESYYLAVPESGPEIKAISFNTDNSQAYLLTTGEDDQAYISYCQVTKNGFISHICHNELIESNLADPISLIADIINYRDKYIYAIINNVIHKCDIEDNGIDIGECKLVSLRSNGSDYSTTFSHFSGLRDSNEKPFIYLNAKSKYIWPAAIDPNTGNLSLMAADPTNTADPELINAGDTWFINNLSFIDSESIAYVGFMSAGKIQSCNYDANIDTNGTINMHGDHNSCKVSSNFEPYQSMELLNMFN